MKDGTFSISTEAFEGPLSLLLELVQKRKIFISDIALSDVADEFIQIVQDRERSLAEDADFVSVASTLLLIKSKSLLPGFQLTPEEEESAEELANRLAMFEAVRSMTGVVSDHYGSNVFLTRQPSQDNQKLFVPDKRLSGEFLSEHVKNVRNLLPQKRMPERLSVKQTVRLEDVLQNLSKRIRKHVALSFREFAGVGKSSKRDVVVHFVALLELVKQGFLEADQRERGGDIELKHQEVGVPNYS